MTRIVIQGKAVVFNQTGIIEDPAVLARFDGYVYDEERFTDYLGGPPDETAVAARGSLAFPVQWERIISDLLNTFHPVL